MNYYGPSYAITNESEFLKYSDLSAYDKSQVKEELIPQGDGTYLLNPEFSLGKGLVKGKKNAFSGKLYILIDEHTGSAAAEFAAIAKSNNIATLVGTETNGAYGGQNATSFVRMTLENSKILVNTPLVKAFNEVKTIQPLDRGTLPHYKVNYTIENVLNRNDVQLKYVKNLIRKQLP